MWPNLKCFSSATVRNLNTRKIWKRATSYCCIKFHTSDCNGKPLTTMEGLNTDFTWSPCCGTLQKAEYNPFQGPALNSTVTSQKLAQLSFGCRKIMMEYKSGVTTGDIMFRKLFLYLIFIFISNPFPISSIWISFIFSWNNILIDDWVMAEWSWWKCWHAKLLKRLKSSKHYWIHCLLASNQPLRHFVLKVIHEENQTDVNIVNLSYGAVLSL